jgi:NAD(P)-dependent dehydrogenase (short-subunit alcohol dehydrogenase family)
MEALHGAVSVIGVHYPGKRPLVRLHRAETRSGWLMSKTDALLYAKQGIRVNSVHPGFIWTPMVEKYLRSLGDVAELRRGLDALHPIGRIGEPEEVAWGILYLASDESKFVTGSELVIDGGYTAQ